jgi:hypothetical protein
VVGFPEQLEFLDQVGDAELESIGGRAAVTSVLLRAALATADFYLENTALDGIPYWDTGASELHRLGDWRAVPADPFNAYEPVDSSAAAIAAQGLLRLGRWLDVHRAQEVAGPPATTGGLTSTVQGDDAPVGVSGQRYWQAGLTVAARLLTPDYLSEDPSHHGLLLHSIYHRPNGWDHVAQGQQVPNGESSMWGDYHLRELALYVQREATGGPYLTFFGPLRGVTS